MSYGTRLCCISMRSNAVSLALSYVYAMYTRECVYTCVYACGGLFLNRSKTIFRVSLSRSAHQRLTLTSTVLRFRGPRGTHKSEHLEFLDSFFPRDQLHSRDIINRRSPFPFTRSSSSSFSSSFSSLARGVVHSLLIIKRKARISNCYDNNDDATSRSYFWRQTCESNNSPSALISRLRDASLNPERRIARFIIEYTALCSRGISVNDPYIYFLFNIRTRKIDSKS